MTKERIMIFIDGSNLYYSLKDLGIKKADFKKILALLTENKFLISTFYYNASLNRGIDERKYWEQQKFLIF